MSNVKILPSFYEKFLQSNSNRIFAFCNLIKQAVVLWEILTLNRDLFLPLYCLTKNEGYIYFFYYKTIESSIYGNQAHYSIFQM